MKQSIFNGSPFSVHPVATAEYELPTGFIENGVNAGFPSAAEDFLEEGINLNDHLIRDKETTFIVRVNGSSMKGAGIHNKDLMVVDRSLRPTDGCIAVCIIDNEFVVKRLKVTPNGILLLPENPTFSPIPVSEYADFEVWGVVTYSIQKH